MNSITRSFASMLATALAFVCLAFAQSTSLHAQEDPPDGGCCVRVSNSTACNVTLCYETPAGSRVCRTFAANFSTNWTIPCNTPLTWWIQTKCVLQHFPSCGTLFQLPTGCCATICVAPPVGSCTSHIVINPAKGGCDCL